MYRSNGRRACSPPKKNNSTLGIRSESCTPRPSARSVTPVKKQVERSDAPPQAPQTAHENENLRLFYLVRFPHGPHHSLTPPDCRADPDVNLQTVDCPSGERLCHSVRSANSTHVDTGTANQSLSVF